MSSESKTHRRIFFDRFGLSISKEDHEEGWEYPGNQILATKHIEEHSDDGVYHLYGSLVKTKHTHAHPAVIPNPKWIDHLMHPKMERPIPQRPPQDFYKPKQSETKKPPTPPPVPKLEKDPVPRQRTTPSIPMRKPKKPLHGNSKGRTPSEKKADRKASQARYYQKRKKQLAARK